MSDEEFKVDDWFKSDEDVKTTIEDVLNNDPEVHEIHQTLNIALRRKGLSEISLGECVYLGDVLSYLNKLDYELQLVEKQPKNQ